MHPFHSLPKMIHEIGRNRARTVACLVGDFSKKSRRDENGAIVDSPNGKIRPVAG
jgi:hypothetical protein